MYRRMCVLVVTVSLSLSVCVCEHFGKLLFQNMPTNASCGATTHKKLFLLPLLFNVPIGHRHRWLLASVGRLLGGLVGCRSQLCLAVFVQCPVSSVLCVPAWRWHLAFSCGYWMCKNYCKLFRHTSHINGPLECDSLSRPEAGAAPGGMGDILQSWDQPLAWKSIKNACWANFVLWGFVYLMDEQTTEESECKRVWVGGSETDRDIQVGGRERKCLLSLCTICVWIAN